MRPLAHAVTSGVISVFVGLHFRSIKCAAVSFAAGTIIDLDHLLDYFASHPLTLRVKDIYDACAETRMKKLYLVFHSYEIVIILWAAIYVLALSNAWKALAIGLTQHIIFDQLTNPVRGLSYFFCYRLMNGFKKETMLHQRSA